MHKLFIPTQPLSTVTLHLVSKGSNCCNLCRLAAPRMRMFYTDDREVYSVADVIRDIGGMPSKMVDDHGRTFYVSVCTPVPF